MPLRQPDKQPDQNTCTHDDAPFSSRRDGIPVPDETVRCPDCLERVKFHQGGVITVREGNALLDEERETFEEAQRCLREGDRDGLLALLDRSRPFRADEAARQARVPYDPTCGVVGCERPKARGITICETHGRDWDTRHTRDEFRAMGVDEKHQDWLRFLRGERYAA